MKIDVRWWKNYQLCQSADYHTSIWRFICWTLVSGSHLYCEHQHLIKANSSSLGETVYVKCFGKGKKKRNSRKIIRANSYIYLIHTPTRSTTEAPWEKKRVQCDARTRHAGTWSLQNKHSSWSLDHTGTDRANFHLKTNIWSTKQTECSVPTLNGPWSSDHFKYENTERIRHTWLCLLNGRGLIKNNNNKRSIL